MKYERSSPELRSNVANNLGNIKTQCTFTFFDLEGKIKWEEDIITFQSFKCEIFVL